MAQRLVTHGKYYADDTEQRKRYFDQQFLALSRELAAQQSISLSQFFRDLKDFSSFKAYLETVFSLDLSLANYNAGMSDIEKREFFSRNVIQRIVEDNLEEKEEDIDRIKAPIFVQQVKKKTRKWFTGTIKGRRVRGYETRVKIRGKTVSRLRDARGRFIKRV